MTDYVSKKMLTYDFVNPEEAILEGIRRLEDFFQSMGIPTRMRDMPDVGMVPEEIMEKMARRVRITNTNGTIGTLKQLTTEDVVNIFKLAQ